MSICDYSFLSNYCQLSEHPDKLSRYSS